MSTRGAFGFYINGETKVIYNHCDSYIEGLGADIFQALQRFFTFYPEFEKNKKELRRIANKIVLINSEKNYTPLDNFEAEHYFDKKQFKDLNNQIIPENFKETMEKNRDKNCFYFYRGFEVLGEKYTSKRDINFYLYEKNKIMEMKDARDFLEDDLFCEYAYIINVDDDVLEIYMSGAHSSIKESPYNIDLVAEYSFEEIIDMSLAKFLKLTTKIENDYRNKIA